MLIDSSNEYLLLVTHFPPKVCHVLMTIEAKNNVLENLDGYESKAETLVTQQRQLNAFGRERKSCHLWQAFGGENTHSNKNNR